MSGAFGMAGWHFSRNPTSASSENPVSKAPDSEPWKTGSHAQYQYHPGGDTSKARKDAPSALNEVIVPNVNLPRVSFSFFPFFPFSFPFYPFPFFIISTPLLLACFVSANQPLFCLSNRSFTKSTTSGARMATKWTSNRALPHFCIDTSTRKQPFSSSSFCRKTNSHAFHDSPL
jgi:hypothetical protein